MQTPRGAVVVRLDGGLGNQMFQYAAGRAAALPGGRELWLDPRGIAARGDGRRYGLDAFALEPSFLTPRERFLIRAATGARVPAAIRGLVQAFGGRWQLVREGAAAIPTEGNVVLEGYWQAPAWFAGAEGALRGDFAFRTPPGAVVAEWAARIGAGESVAVHVRRGDYVSSPEVRAVHNTLEPAYYEAAGAVLRRHVDGARYYLFSDDPDWAEAHVRLPGPTTTVRCAGDAAPHDDLRLMAACRHAIIANSSFSWWGAWLGHHPGQVVTAPARWFRGRPAPAGLIPPEWIVVADG